MYKDVTGIILSGGKSTRMGQNKSLLKVGGKTIIERVRDLMRSLFEDVILITNEPGEYKFLELPVFEDVYTYKGPLAGIHSGLLHSSNELNFIISCDLPFITVDLIKYLLDYKTDNLITVARADGFIQQLAGMYSKSVLPIAEKLLKENIENESRSKSQNKRKCKVLSLLQEVGAEIIDAENLDFYKEGIFFNMNRPDDYNEIIKLI